MNNREKNKKKSFILILKWFLLLIGAFLFTYGLITLILGKYSDKLAIFLTVGSGVVFIMAAGMSVVKKIFGKHIGRVINLLSTLFVISHLTVFVIILLFSGTNLPDNGLINGDNTVMVILGARVNGNSPSLSLKYRLDSASEILIFPPYNSIHCIVTGGQGLDETQTEASVMKSYLVGKGVNPSIIYTEDKSTSTQENFKFAHDISSSVLEPENLIVVSNNFHLYRSTLMARLNGFETQRIYRISSGVPVHYYPLYFTREIFAIYNTWVFESAFFTRLL